MSHSDCEIESGDVEIETLELNYSNSKENIASATNQTDANEQNHSRPATPIKIINEIDTNSCKEEFYKDQELDNRSNSNSNSPVKTPVKNYNLENESPQKIDLTPSKTNLNQSFKEKILNNLPVYKRVSLEPFKHSHNFFRFENLFAFGIVFILIAVYALSYISNPIPGASSATIATVDESKKSLISQLKNNFPNQTKGFYSNVISCYEHSVTGNQDPAIIILVSDKHTTKNVNCVAKNLLKFLLKDHDGEFDYTLAALNSVKYKNKDSENVKKELDTDLINIFSNMKGKIALIENIENIPAKSMMLFYSYGDDLSTAKYKGIMILLTYELSEEIISNNKEKYEELTKSYNKLSSFVEKDINDRWSVFIDYDQLKPLYTRIANNIILVNNEKSCE